MPETEAPGYVPPGAGTRWPANSPPELRERFVKADRPVKITDITRAGKMPATPAEMTINRLI